MIGASIRWWHDQKLGEKLKISLAGIGLLMSLVIWLTLRLVVMPAFENIEARDNQEQMQRVSHSLEVFNETMTGWTLDYAVWDDAYEYISGRRKQFEAETLTPVAYQNMQSDLVAVVRFDRHVVWSQVVDLPTGRVLAEEGARFARLLSHSALFEQARAHRLSAAYVRTPRGIYALHSAWITKSDGTGTPIGFLVKGRMLSAENLSKALQVAVTVRESVDPALNRALLASPQHRESVFRPGMIENTVGLLDQSGGIIGTIRFSTPRTISAAGEKAVGMATAAMLVSFIVMALLMGFGINRIAVSRLRKLRHHVETYHENRRGMDSGLLRGNDEIARLAQEFDELSRRLAQAEDKLRERSYLQGKADSAAGLLHNVRNSLSPVRVALEKWLYEEEQPFRANLRKALDAVEDPACTDERRADLFRFIVVALRKICSESSVRVSELVDSKDAVDQISRILSSYNQDSARAVDRTTVDLQKLIVRETQQLKMQYSGLIDISLPENVPAVRANDIQLAQVVTNLLVNAVDSMKAAMVPRMKLDISAVPDASCRQLVLRIRDNGEGALPETLTAAFERGFSTRTDKVGGIGLHWCANTVRAMEGELALESDGPGTGATAVLKLPLADSGEARADPVSHAA